MQKIEIKDLKNLSWKSWFMIITMLLAAGLGGGTVNVMMNVQGEVAMIKDSLQHTINSTFYGLQKPASYIVSVVTSGATTYYCMQNGTTGALDFWSTNASAVIERCSTANTTIYFKEGQYAINNLLPVNQSNMHFIGSGWSTQFTIGTGGGFNISSTSALTDISFENIRWMDASGGTGAGTSAYGITSAMPAQMRISHFKFSGNRVDYFRKAGTIFLDLVNLEVSTIENNFFFHTTTAFIQLSAYRYECGNNKVFDNVFYFGYDVASENAIRLTSDNGNSTFYSIVAHIYSWGNQFYGEAYGGTAIAWRINVTADYGTVYGLNSQGDRYETVMPLYSVGRSTSYKSYEHLFSGNHIYSNDDNVISFYLNTYTRSTVIDNNIFRLSGSNVSGLDDDWSPSGAAAYPFPNEFTNNKIYDTDMILNASYATRVYGNTNINPIGYVANWKATDSSISPFQGYASTFTNETTYTVRTCPVYFKVTGGTGVNITVSDADGNAYVNGATTPFEILMPIDTRITCVFASSPSVVAIFDGVAVDTTNPKMSYHYLVYTDGTYTYMKNGTTGMVDFYSTNSTLVINAALGNLTVGRTWKEKVTLKGNFSGLSQIQVPSYTEIEVQGLLKAKALLNTHLIFADLKNDIEIHGGDIDGYGWNQTSDTDTMLFSNCTRIAIHDCKIGGAHRVTVDGESVEFENTSDSSVSHCNFYTYPGAYDHIKLTTGSTRNVIANNVINGAGGNNSNAIQIAGATVSCTWNTIIGNQITSPAISGSWLACGIKVHSGTDNTIEGNTVSYAKSAGIDLLENASRNIVIGNNINATSYCLLIGNVTSVDQAVSNVFQNNLCIMNSQAGTSYGVYIQDNAISTRVLGNVFIGGSGTETAIYVSGLANLTKVKDNDVSDSLIGTKFLDYASNSVFVDNAGYNPCGYIANPVSGVYLTDSGSGAMANATTYTVSESPKLLTINNGTIIALYIDGQITIGSTAGITARVTLRLEPNQTVQIVWSSAPQIKVFGQ